MLDLNIKDRGYLQSQLLLKAGGITHGFTKKLGGVSRGKITGLNLGFRVDDDPDSVMENYRFVAEDLGFTLDNAVLSRQTHTDNIRIVTSEDMGKGITKESDIYDTDGLITNVPNVPLVVFSADCTPLLLFDPEKRVIAAVHAGWRGTVKKIAEKAVMIMKDTFGCHPENILAAIGPCIGPCCFEFGKEATEYFPEEFCTPTKDGKFLVDIWGINKEQLEKTGVLTEHIDIAEICTVCRADQYYSYRTHGENTGRQAAIISLNEV